MSKTIIHQLGRVSKSGTKFCTCGKLFGHDSIPLIDQLRAADVKDRIAPAKELQRVRTPRYHEEEPELIALVDDMDIALDIELYDESDIDLICLEKDWQSYIENEPISDTGNWDALKSIGATKIG